MDDPRIDEMENRKDERHEPEWCEECEGWGWVSGAEHDPTCDGGSRCQYLCPVQVQVFCPACKGKGVKDE